MKNVWIYTNEKLLGVAEAFADDLFLLLAHSHQIEVSPTGMHQHLNVDSILNTHTSLSHASSQENIRTCTVYAHSSYKSHS